MPAQPAPAAAATAAPTANAEAQNHPAAGEAVAQAPAAVAAAPPTAQAAAAPAAQATVPQNQAAPAGAQQAQAGGAAPPGAQGPKPKTPEELALELAEAEVEVLAQQFIVHMSQASTLAAAGSAILSAFAHFHGGFAVALARQVGTILTKVAAESIKLQSLELIKQMDPAMIDQLLAD